MRAYLTAGRRARAGTLAPRPPPPGRGAAAGCCHCRCSRALSPRPRRRLRCPCRGSTGGCCCCGCRAIWTCRGCAAGGSAPSPSPPPRAWRARRGSAGPAGLAPPQETPTKDDQHHRHQDRPAPSRTSITDQPATTTTARG
jgi:hypothetical protein